MLALTAINDDGAHPNVAFKLRRFLVYRHRYCIRVDSTLIRAAHQKLSIHIHNVALH